MSGSSSDTAMAIVRAPSARPPPRLAQSLPPPAVDVLLEPSPTTLVLFRPPPTSSMVGPAAGLELAVPPVSGNLCTSAAFSHTSHPGNGGINPTVNRAPRNNAVNLVPWYVATALVSLYSPSGTRLQGPIHVLTAIKKAFGMHSTSTCCHKQTRNLSLATWP
ncbi:hypothetical protein CDD82_2950 [Ophiocordyceps australis]|uniref:Uncharacterized protein n=1 Tax=Ophiocordyceps australis TaxID=1399860 RepID=A0A2C5XV43_9HYPO|nr:hypothetical protein CDD82_2950 [Ophiocordyceps australis]